VPRPGTELAVPTVITPIARRNDMFTRVRAIALGTTLLVAAAGCSVMEGQQSLGAYTSDAAITAKVKSKLLDDPAVSGTQISVETMNGVVQLSGSAKSAEAERRALQIARSVEGVKSVRDSIEVRQSAAR
jgi:osmotically-inducible protein OsmY